MTKFSSSKDIENNPSTLNNYKNILQLLGEDYLSISYDFSSP
jgi:hypothetical protein